MKKFSKHNVQTYNTALQIQLPGRPLENIIEINNRVYATIAKLNFKTNKKQNNNQKKLTQKAKLN